MRIGSLLLILSVMACGGGGGNGSPDGGDDVQPIDAPAPDANTHVEVTVYQDGAVAPGLVVQYADAAGAYVASVTTDADGHATIDPFPAGGSLTAPVSPRGQAGQLTSVEGVQGGDSITIGHNPAQGIIGSFDLTLTGTTVANATNYFSEVECSGYVAAPSGIRHHALFWCDEDAPPTIVSGILYASSGGNSADHRLAYDTVTDIPITGTVPNLTGAGSLTGWRTDFATHTITSSNTPAGKSVVPFVHGFRAGHTFRTDQGSIDTSPQTLALADGFFDAEAAGIDVYSDSGDSIVTVHGATVPTAAAPLSSSFDGTADVLAPIALAQVAADGTNVAWTGSPAGCRDNPGPPDAFMAAIQADSITWTVIAPGTQTSPVQLPALDPATASTLWPVPQNPLNIEAGFVSDTALTWSDIEANANAIIFEQDAPPAEGTRCLDIAY
jgi:hypothetical protein